MFNTSESTATGRKGSFGLKLGALVAASSLMLAGGVAVATSVYAAPNDNANGQGQGNKPDKTDNPNKPDNGGGNAGGNSGNPNPPKDDPSGSNNPDFEAGAKVWICHADANNGQGNENLGNNGQGGENKNGFNIIYISKQAWLSNHDRLHENDKGPFQTEAEAQAACGGQGNPFTASLSYCATQDGWATYNPAAGPFPGSSTESQEAANAATLTAAANEGWTVDTTGEKCATTTDAFPGGAEVSHSFCQVDGNGYKIGTLMSNKSASSTASVDAANETAKNEANRDLIEQLKAQALRSPQDIIPSYLDYSGNNWASNSTGRAIWAEGCVLADGQTVASAISAPLAATTAPAAGKPNPGTVQVPAAGAPLPGSVPAGDGSSLPGLPVWALALLAVGALGAAASGMSLATSRKG